MRGRRRAGLAAFPVLVLAASLVSGCSASGRVLANEPLPAPPGPSSRPEPTPGDDPRPVRFPEDEAPHGRLTEWWYYTGHLRTAAGARYGFELVVFRAERGIFPPTWASHVAFTDEADDRFAYDQRVEIGPQVDRSAPNRGFDLAIRGGSRAPDGSVARTSGSAWWMAGANGHDEVSVQTDSFGLRLSLDSHGRPPLLHDTRGWVHFGPAGGSYYYSRTRLAAEGRLRVGDREWPVEGIAWFDHQWGDFIAVGAGGWDWFAVNLNDGTDLLLSLVRDREGGYPLVYGELLALDGAYRRHLARSEFSVESTGSWTSRRTGIRYPAGWLISIPAERLRIELTPTVDDQELDTRETTGVIYWEGSQVVRASRDSRPLGGEAYVELTGYEPPG
jgi:predicted secreted hydrolase